MCLFCISTNKHTTPKGEIKGSDGRLLSLLLKLIYRVLLISLSGLSECECCFVKKKNEKYAKEHKVSFWANTKKNCCFASRVLVSDVCIQCLVLYLFLEWLVSRQFSRKVE